MPGSQALLASAMVVADGTYHRVLAADHAGRTCALRICHRSQWDRTPYEQLLYEFNVLRAVEAAGIAPVAYAIASGTPPILIEEFIRGRPYGRTTDGPGLAASLARLHRIAVTTRLMTLLASQSSIDDLEVTTRLARLRKSGAALPLQSVAARFPVPDGGPPAIVHGDLVVGNLLVDDSGTCRILDWEGARLADPAWDLAYHISPLTAWWSTPNAERPALDALPDGSDVMLAAYAEHAGTPERSVRLRVAAWMPRVVLRTIIWAADLSVSQTPRDARLRAVAALADLDLRLCLIKLQEMIAA